VTDFIYHIATRAAWAQAQRKEIYFPDSIAAEGFIHCSQSSQVLRVANTWFSHQQGLVILEIDMTMIRSILRWEPGTDISGELFPHLYGPLHLEAVKRVFEFEPGPDGSFSLPGGLIG
jgi:uncharacterized protein (DUF952 family)